MKTLGNFSQIVLINDNINKDNITEKKMWIQLLTKSRLHIGYILQLSIFYIICIV